MPKLGWDDGYFRPTSTLPTPQSPNSNDNTLLDSRHGDPVSRCDLTNHGRQGTTGVIHVEKRSARQRGQETIHVSAIFVPFRDRVTHNIFLSGSAISSPRDASPDPVVADRQRERLWRNSGSYAAIAVTVSRHNR